MKSLFISEFQRLYYRKSTWACFLAIPVLLIASAKYYLGVNITMDVSNPQYTSFLNFPVAAMQEQLILGFNMIVVLLMILSVTQEVRNSSIRMVLIRKFKPIEVFMTKFLVIIATIFIYLVTYLILGYIVGFILFPKIDNVYIFYWGKAFDEAQAFIYTIKYYLISFLTLLSIASVMFFIATISKSVVIALGLSASILLGLIAYPTIIQILLFDNINLIKYQLLSITQVQYQGIAMMIGEKNSFNVFNLSIIGSYILIFLLSSYAVYKKNDNLM